MIHQHVPNSRIYIQYMKQQSTYALKCLISEIWLKSKTDLCRANNENNYKSAIGLITIKILKTHMQHKICPKMQNGLLGVQKTSNVRE